MKTGETIGSKVSEPLIWGGSAPAQRSMTKLKLHLEVAML
jgi:hypothetical protein